MGFNKIILEGNLSKDITLRYSGSGMAMAQTSIAVNKKFTSSGEKKEKVLFVKLQFWGRSAEIANQYLQKGSNILIDGELENNNWVDAQGNKKYDFVVNVSSMTMLGTKESIGQRQQAQPQQPQPDYNSPQGGYTAPTEQIDVPVDEQEIPF